MNALEFSVPGLPVPKGRPRFAVRGGHARAYTPARTESYEAVVRKFGYDACQASGCAFPMQGVAFEVHLDFQMPIPASWSQKRRALVTGMDVVAHVKRPDLDNLEKAVLDGLNGVVWNDDAQVFRLTKVKRYGLEPKTTVRITWHE